MTASVDPDEALLHLAETHLRQLRELFRSRSLQISAHGTFAALVVAYSWKQEDHADAILALGKHGDVQLIARSMIEGLCQLKWAANDPDTRAKRWRLFAWVHDWQLMDRNLRSGKEVPPATRDRIEQGIAEHGGLFETDKAVRERRRGKSVRDPYVHHWSGKTVAELCDEVKGQLLYDWAYADFSDWHHWSPGGVTKAFKTEGRMISFPAPKARDVLPSYAVAFQCLYETMEVANTTFKLGLDGDLQTIREGFVRDLTPARANLQAAKPDSDS